MRMLNDHVVNLVVDKIGITVLDEPGAGGANHLYQMAYITTDGTEMLDHIKFQKGPINDVGVNGVTQEVLLAIVIDRLRSFQAGPFACPENEEALRFAQGSLSALQRRTKDRMARGVEGKSVA